VARQLRLRNIGGIIVIDFVDMDKESNRKKVWDELHRHLAGDRSRCNVTKISELGLVEMTRKRTRESLHQLLSEPCPTCEGSGVVKSTTTVANEVLREVRRVGSLIDADVIEVECAPRIADLLAQHEREYMDELEKKFQKKVSIQGVRGYRQDQFKVTGRGEAGEPRTAPPASGQEQRNGQRSEKRSRRGGRRRGGNGNHRGTTTS
jgi:ribonuclease G